MEELSKRDKLGLIYINRHYPQWSHLPQEERLRLFQAWSAGFKWADDAQKDFWMCDGSELDDN